MKLTLHFDAAQTATKSPLDVTCEFGIRGPSMALGTAEFTIAPAQTTDRLTATLQRNGAPFQLAGEKEKNIIITHTFVGYAMGNTIKSGIFEISTSRGLPHAAVCFRNIDGGSFAAGAPVTFMPATALWLCD